MAEKGTGRKGFPWSRNKDKEGKLHSDSEESIKRPEKWSLGILNDRETDEVPGESTNITFDYLYMLTDRCVRFYLAPVQSIKS